MNSDFIGCVVYDKYGEDTTEKNKEERKKEESLLKEELQKEKSDLQKQVKESV